jgi:hypothetical protein
MPWKSDAQRRGGNSMAGMKAMGSKDVEEYNDASKGMKIPEHVPVMSNHPMMKKVTVKKHPVHKDIEIHHIHRGK